MSVGMFWGCSAWGCTLGGKPHIAGSQEFPTVILLSPPSLTKFFPLEPKTKGFPEPVHGQDSADPWATQGTAAVGKRGSSLWPHLNPGVLPSCIPNYLS